MFAVAGEKSYLSAGAASAAHVMLRSVALSCRSRTEAIVGGSAGFAAALACAKAATEDTEHTIIKIAIALMFFTVALLDESGNRKGYHLGLTGRAVGQ